MATFSVTNTFIANTRARAAEVNRNFTDVLDILAAHHHDPGIYTGATPITNSGIAANAQILDTQLQSPITRSGLINDAALQNVSAPKGGTGLASVVRGDIIIGSGTNLWKRLAIGTAGQSLQVAANGVPAWADVTLNTLSKAYTAGESIDASTTPQAVYLKASDGKIYKADTDADESTYSFVGFVGSGQNVVADQSVTVTYGGVISGFSGLTAGDRKYLSATAGAISTTPPSSRKLEVGFVMSASDMLIYPKDVRIVAFSDSVSTGTTQVTNTKTVGFRPRTIIGVATISGNLVAVDSFFTVDDAAGQKALNCDVDESSGRGRVKTSNIAQSSDGDDDSTTVINNFTATGFDIVYNRGNFQGTSGSVSGIVIG